MSSYKYKHISSFVVNKVLFMAYNKSFISEIKKILKIENDKQLDNSIDFIKNHI